MTSHDQLWKDLFRTFFPDLLFLLDSDLAARLVGSLGPGGFTFLDKEVFHDLPEGDRHEVDLLAEALDPATGLKLRVHVEIERRFSGEIGRRVARYAYHLYLRDPGPVVSIVVFLRGGPFGIRWGTTSSGRSIERSSASITCPSDCRSFRRGRYSIDRSRSLGRSRPWPGRAGWAEPD